MSHRGGYVGDYIGDCYRGSIKEDTKSLDCKTYGKLSRGLQGMIIHDHACARVHSLKRQVVAPAVSRFMV